jgi:VCBS repeat-containing protein
MSWHFRFGLILGNRHPNVLEGADWSDLILGFGGDDVIEAGGGNDTVLAGRGDDRIQGGAGNDYIDGGRGFDTAAFDGSIFDYDITLGRGWFSSTAIVTRFGDDGHPVEVDYLKRVEALHFAEEDYTLYLDGRNNAVLALDDAATTDEDTALTLSFDDLLANDTDFDGDTLTVTQVDALSSLGAVISVVDGKVIYSPAGVFDALKEGETVTDSFSYTVDDGHGGSSTATVSVTVTGTNDAPELQLVPSVDYSENGSGVVVTATASDVDSDGVAFSLSGEDSALFTIDETTGEIRFVAVPDFEMPADADGDNAYELVVTATDTEGATDAQAVTVNVTDVVEVPDVDARINEFHYDNAGTDTGEFVEIRVNAGADVSTLDVRLINGNGGAQYNLAAVSGLTMTSDGTFDYYVWDLPSNGLQNGAPDGIALVHAGEVVEFLTYEGVITTTIEGVEVTSTDVGVAESGDTAAGDSLQRNEDGSWSEAAAETKGAENGGGTGSLVEARINEIHYDNDGTDTGEFVEIRVNADADVGGLQVQLINGNGGASYNSVDVSTLTMTSDGTYDYYVWDLPSNGIQNGAPDGVALVNGTEVVEFLSYEGEMTATIAGTEVTSTDIGVSENNATLVGQSLQRNDDGSWNAPAAETRGEANDGGTGGEPTARFISEIQGTGSASLLAGDYVLVSAVVTYTTGNGFFLQEEDADADGDILTSEGIFVFTGSAPSVVAGDTVDVAGTVEEFFGMTQLGGVEVTKTGTTTLPTAAAIQLSRVATNYEQYEGMRISVTSGIENERVTIIENFNFDRFGDITVSAGTQTQATQLYDAQTEADEIAAHVDGNMNNRLVITDGTSSQNPDSYGYVANNTAGDDGDGILSAGDDFSADGPTLRLGAELNSAIEGVLTYEFGEYKVLVDGTLDIDESTNSGARQDMPDDVGGEIQVASFNVLNYFTTFSGGTGPNGDLSPRGADSQAEFDRQTAKIVDAMVKTGAEVFALQEIENNGFGDASAIAALVDALNARALADGSGAVYDYANPLGGDGFLGSDAIMTGIVYDTTQLTLVHAEGMVFTEASAADTYAIAGFLNNYVSASDQVGDFQRNRPSTIATFQDANGEVFTIASSHFKSKGDSNLQDLADGVQAALDGGSVPAGEVAAVQAALDALIADPNFDQGNGQGFWNQVRADAAGELAAYLEGGYADALAGLGIADPDYLLMGDFNAYAEEDPVQAVRDDAGFIDLIDQFLGQDEAYSYVFDGQQGTLDQALASESLADQVTNLTEWHINADEPDLLNYDQDFNNPGFYSEDPFAASDHDPVILGLNLGDTLLA